MISYKSTSFFGNHSFIENFMFNLLKLKNAMVKNIEVVDEIIMLKLGKNKGH